MKNILFISQYFPPDITAAAFRISETAQILQREGFGVKVLTALPHKSEVAIEKENKKYDVVRVPILKLKSKKVIMYLLHYFSFLINSFLGGLVKISPKFDYIMATSPPLPVALSGFLLSRFKNAEFILDVRDVWPDSAIGTGHFREGSIIYRLAKRMELFLYKKSDLITCVSQEMKSYIKNYIKDEKPILVLYNGLSDSFLNKLPKNITTVKSDNKFTISYLGNFGYVQRMDLIVKLAQILKGRNIQFILKGVGALKKRLLKEKEQMKLNNLTILDPCSKEDAFGFMCNSDVLLIMLDNRFKAFRLTIPSKVFDYLWANKPILYSIEGEGKEILGSMPGNIYFDSENIDSAQEAITKLKNNYDFYKEKAQRNREFVLSRFRREKSVRRLKSYLV